MLSLGLREVEGEVFVTPDTASLVSSLELADMKQGLAQARSSLAAFRSVLSSESKMINETKVEPRASQTIFRNMNESCREKLYLIYFLLLLCRV